MVQVMSLFWRAWRTMATLSCFALFAVGGVVVGGICLPLVRILRRDEGARHRLGRWIVHKSFHAFITYMRGTGVLKLRVENLQGLRKPGTLVVANHPTLIDFVILGSLIPHADCLVKSELMRDWFKRWPIRLAGYILNDQGETTLAHCRRSLETGNNIVIFPEGTRTPPGRPVAFQKGAAQVAVRIRQNLTPVVIQSRGSNLEKGGKWYLAPKSQLTVNLRVLDEIDVDPFLNMRQDQPALAARDLHAHLQQRFNQELSLAGA
jgi:1-acyl-sn-glycerol-3-phosphate acyltransferase